jgi:hypothetical protein
MPPIKLARGLVDVRRRARSLAWVAPHVGQHGTERRPKEHGLTRSTIPTIMGGVAVRSVAPGATTAATVVGVPTAALLGVVRDARSSWGHCNNGDTGRGRCVWGEPFVGHVHALWIEGTGEIGV